MRNLLTVLMALVSAGIIFILLYAAIVYWPLNLHPIAGWIAGGAMAFIILVGYAVGMIKG